MNLPRISSQYIAISGGMDLSTSPIVKVGSEAIMALNVQPLIGGGFTQIEGYECLDGKITPSACDYKVLSLDRPIAGIPESVTVDQRQFKVLDAFEQILIITGLPDESVAKGQNVTLSGENYTIEQINKEISDVQKHRRYLAAVFAYWNRQVKPPTTGSLRGVVEFDNDLIVFADNGERGAAYIANKTQHWRALTLPYQIRLDVSNADLLNDHKQFTVANTTYHVIEIDFAVDRHQATLYCSQPLNVNDQLRINEETVATVQSCEAVQLAGGGNYQVLYHNFYGGLTTRYAYVCNQKQVLEVRADGTILPIDTQGGIPNYIAVHKNHLFVAFQGGQLGHSLVGYPRRWSILLGAEHFAIGSEITAISTTAGGVLLICSQRKVTALYGNTADDWQMKDLSNIGIFAGTLQTAFVPIGISDNGIVRIDQTEQFGDFKLSETDANRKLSFSPQQHQIAFSATNPALNQVRFYSRDNWHISVMLLPDGTTRSTYFSYPNRLSGVWQTEKWTYLAFNDGKLYRQNSQCRSFAGKPIEWLVKMAFNHFGSPTTVKSWHSAELQATTEGETVIQYRYDLDYNAAHHAINLTKDINVYGGGGRWKESFWNNFLWSAEDYSTPTFELSGYSRNLSISFSGGGVYAAPLELTGLVINYIQRRLYRV